MRQVVDKLGGANPVVALEQDLRNGHAKRAPKYLEKFVKILKGTPGENARAKYESSHLTPVQQVSYRPVTSYFYDFMSSFPLFFFNLKFLFFRSNVFLIWLQTTRCCRGLTKDGNHGCETTALSYYPRPNLLIFF